MKRRDFLELTGGACLAALGGELVAEAQNQSTPARREPALMDRELLRNRNQNRSTVICRHGIVCTSQPLASMAGVDILKAGGSAVRRGHRRQRHDWTGRADELRAGRRPVCHHLE